MGSHREDKEWFPGKDSHKEEEPEKKRRRGRIEMWFDRHNHKMEFLRTMFGLIAAGTGVFVFLKVFGLI
jgi:hypothetical protein